MTIASAAAASFILFSYPGSRVASMGYRNQPKPAEPERSERIMGGPGAALLREPRVDSASLDLPGMWLPAFQYRKTRRRAASRPGGDPGRHLVVASDDAFWGPEQRALDPAAPGRQD